MQIIKYELLGHVYPREMFYEGHGTLKYTGETSRLFLFLIQKSAMSRFRCSQIPSFQDEFSHF